MGSNLNRWTADEDAVIVKMRAEGISWERIGRKLGRSGDSVKSRHKRYETGDRPMPKPFTENDDLIIKQLTDEGYNTVDIASLMAGRTASDICERQADLFDFTGIKVTQFMTDRGMDRTQAHDWLFRRGYSFDDGVIVKRPSYAEIEREIINRVVTAPPSGPCWRCGARICGHMATNWSPTQVAA